MMIKMNSSGESKKSKYDEILDEIIVEHIKEESVKDRHLVTAYWRQSEELSPVVKQLLKEKPLKCRWR